MNCSRRILMGVDGFRVLSCLFYSILEWSAVHVSFVNKVLVRHRRATYQQELEYAGIQEGMVVGVVGCGFWPYMTEVLAVDFKVRVNAFDMNRIAVNNAILFLDHRGLLEQVSVDVGNGVNVEYGDFDVVIVAINVWPLYEVLIHVANTMKPLGIVVVRGMRNDVDRVLGQGLEELFDKVAEIRYTRSETSYLRLRKK